MCVILAKAKPFIIQASCAKWASNDNSLLFNKAWLGDHLKESIKSEVFGNMIPSLKWLYINHVQSYELIRPSIANWPSFNSVCSLSTATNNPASLVFCVNFTPSFSSSSGCARVQ